MHTRTQVRVPAHCLTSNNRHVRSRQLWGCDVYTEDSDIVAVLVHCGYWSLFLAHPPAAVAEVRVLVRTKPPQACYPSVARNSIRSRAWAAPISVRVCVEGARVCVGVGWGD